MPNLMLQAIKSLTITSKLPNGAINSGTISVGYDNDFFYGSYLFFDTSTILSNITINYAHLILFKNQSYKENQNYSYTIYPLLDYFSSQSSYENRAHYSNEGKVNFSYLDNKVYIDTDITNIVNIWRNDQLENKGLFIKPRDTSSPLISFGSATSSDNTLKPLLKINYEERKERLYSDTNLAPTFYINCRFIKNYPVSLPIPEPKLSVKYKLYPKREEN
jgi:hypothetical protein